MLNNLQLICLKLPHKEQFKKKLKQLVICLVIKLIIELQKFQNNSEAVTNEHDKEIPKKRYISSEEKPQIIDNLRSIIIV